MYDEKELKENQNIYHFECFVKKFGSKNDFYKKCQMLLEKGLGEKICINEVIDFVIKKHLENKGEKEFLRLWLKK